MIRYIDVFKNSIYTYSYSMIYSYVFDKTGKLHIGLLKKIISDNDTVMIEFSNEKVLLNFHNSIEIVISDDLKSITNDVRLIKSMDTDLISVFSKKHSDNVSYYKKLMDKYKFIDDNYLSNIIPKDTIKEGMSVWLTFYDSITIGFVSGEYVYIFYNNGPVGVPISVCSQLFKDKHSCQTGFNKEIENLMEKEIEMLNNNNKFYSNILNNIRILNNFMYEHE